MTDGHSARYAFLGPVALGFTYFILAFGSLLWTRGGVGIATMWPAGGLAVAILSSADRRLLGRYAVAVVFGSMAANAVSGTSVMLAGIFTLANVIETLVAVILLSRCPFGRPSFVDVRQVACFCAIAAIASVAGMAMASAAVGWVDWRFSLSWFATDFLGIVIIAPLVFIAADRRNLHFQNSTPAVRSGKLAVSLALVAIVGAVTFAQSSLPLLFMSMAALLGATYACGPLGAAAGTMVIAVIGSAALTLGVGPTVLIHGMPGTQAFFLQFYLVVLLGCSLPMAALQTTREALVASLTERNRLLFMAERVAKIGHWHLDLGIGKITWSEEVFRIHGFQGGEEPGLEAALAAYHEEDREGLSAVLASSMSSGASFRHRARIVRQDGDIRHVDVSGEVAMVDGTAMSVFGVVQDVTRQVEIELRLEAAREDAVATATRATVLAETDALTGLANRRRVIEALAVAVRKSEETGMPLSVAMFDIDHFKNVNDVHGHAVGDAVLKRVAASAERATRSTDLVGRLGGEEFLMLLPGADVDAAMEAAERLRTRVEADGTGGIGDPRVTASVGVAALAHGEDLTSLMHRADLALYRAKTEGRNASRLAA